MAPFSWTGFYVGANLGALWSHDGVEVTNGFAGLPVGTTDNLDPSGVLGGLQAGYNLQFSSFVGGVEGDLDWSSARGSHDNLWTLNGLNHTSSLPFFADARLRAGVSFDRFLPYITGGVVFADLHNSLEILGVGRSQATGWTIGAGAEYAIDNHWSVKAEYLYMQFPDASAIYAPSPFTSYQFKFKDSADVARLGLNYRF